MHSDWALRKLQFRTLYRVFLLRIVDLELLSADGDLTRLLGQFASIFATFSFCITAPLVLTRGALEMTQAWMFEHFLIETAMTLAGLIAVLNWDAAFPDKRDVLVLAPLPVKRSTLVLAKIAALLAAPALAIISLNIFSGVVWPLLFRSANNGFVTGLKSFPAYWITIFAAGAFFVFSVLTIQGLAANLLPRQLFLRVSAVLQAGCLCLLLSTYFLEPSLESPAALSSPHNQRLLGWLPSYWFFALFNQLNGSMDPSLVPLARRAWAGLAVSVFGACAALLLCYVRMMRQMVEQPDILPGTRSITWWPRFGSSLPAAITLFSLRTLLRSRQHRMILSFYLGLGITIVVGYAKATMGGFGSTGGIISSSLLFASILMMILSVLGLRVVASFPISLPANWIIRMTQIRSAPDYQKAVRFSWQVLGVLPVLLIIACFLLAASPWRPAIGHLAVLLCLGVLLIELCLYTFPKIPFTCSYLPGKGRIHFVFWVCLMFLLRLLSQAAEFEARILNHGRGFIVMILILACAAVGVRWLNEARTARTQDLLFEEEYPAEITALKLG
jgi:hypothetical protein